MDKRFRFYTPLVLGVALWGGLYAASPVMAQKPAPKSGQKAAAFSGVPVSASVAEANKAELVARVKEYNTGDIWPSRVVNDLMTFKLSEAAWKVLLSEKGVETVFGMTSDINSYAKRLGLGDMARAESGNSNSHEANQGEVGEVLDAIKPLLALHLEATQPNISPIAGKLILYAFSDVTGHFELNTWKPGGGKADITLIMLPSAPDVSVTMNTAKTRFVITAPTKSEVPGWSIKMEKGMNRGK